MSDLTYTVTLRETLPLRLALAVLGCRVGVPAVLGFALGWLLK